MIPTATLGRLVTYLRVVAELETEGVLTTSSEAIAGRAHATAFQVRKDLAYCGRLGTRGSGYQVAPLARELRRALGLTRVWHVAIMGVGRLGQALADYPNFDRYDFALRAAYDADPAKVGSTVGPLVVEGLDDLAASVARHALDMAFLTVPATAAQGAADALVAAGIRGILNFAPTVIEVPAHIRVESVDFLAGLTRLTYYVGNPPAEHDAPS
ncbi:redox-sensing transcriptional repressor Rex [soil metagenome]